MLNEIFESIYKRSKWVLLFIHFFSVLGIFSFVSILTSSKLDPQLALSMSILTSAGSMLFIANKINDSKHK